MKIHDGNLEIRSDQSYTRRDQKCNEENEDLWNEFETVFKTNDRRRLEFMWVKGHATKAHIDRQVTTTPSRGTAAGHPIDCVKLSVHTA